MQDLETLENPFADDWRDCLRAHYIHVVREQDTTNEGSLITVLRDTGFNDNEVWELRTAVLESIGIEPEMADVPYIEEPTAEVIEVVEAVELAQEISGVVTVVEDTSAEVIAEIVESAAEAPVEPVQGELFTEQPKAKAKKQDDQEPPKQMSLF
jgi:uncharacterized protein YqgV (UPF0045/DUF77 family)